MDISKVIMDESHCRPYVYDYPRVVRLVISVLLVFLGVVIIWANIWLSLEKQESVRKITIVAAVFTTVIGLSLLAYTMTYESFDRKKHD